MCYCHIFKKKSCSFHIQLQSKLPVRVNKQAAEIFTMHKMFSVIHDMTPAVHMQTNSLFSHFIFFVFRTLHEHQLNV